MYHHHKFISLFFSWYYDYSFFFHKLVTLIYFLSFKPWLQLEEHNTFFSYAVVDNRTKYKQKCHQSHVTFDLSYPSLRTTPSTRASCTAVKKSTTAVSGTGRQGPVRPARAVSTLGLRTTWASGICSARASASTSRCAGSGAWCSSWLRLRRWFWCAACGTSPLRRGGSLHGMLSLW